MNFPKASDAIAAIQALIDKHGDLPVALNDLDTGRLCPIGVTFNGEIIEISSEYWGEPVGLVGNWKEITGDK